MLNLSQAICSVMSNVAIRGAVVCTVVSDVRCKLFDVDINAKPLIAALLF